MKSWNFSLILAASGSLVACGLVLPSNGQATPSQRNDPREFVQSSSPLGDGSVITSRTSAIGGSQTFIAQAQLGPQIPTTGFQPRETWNVPAQNSLMGAGQPISGFVNPSMAQTPTNTLGLEPVGANPPPRRIFRQTFMAPVQMNQPNPVPSSGMPPATFVPPGAFPNQVAPQPIYPPMDQSQQPWLNSPNPFGSNRVNYSPLISLRNLPPGTYLGQGVVGQPKAYVDGEPVRNLLRYILP